MDLKTLNAAKKLEKQIDECKQSISALSLVDMMPLGGVGLFRHQYMSEDIKVPQNKLTQIATILIEEYRERLNVLEAQFEEL